MYCPLTGLMLTEKESVFRREIPARGTAIYFPQREEASQTIRFRDGSTYKVVSSDQRWIPLIKYPFVYQSLYHPMTRILRERLDLDARLGSATGYDRICQLYRVARFLVLDDIRKKWGWPAFWDSIGFGLPDHDTGGACAESSHRFVCLAAACGYVARKVNIGRNDPQSSLPHVCTEIWSDEHQKWVFWDAMVPYYFEDVKSGAPLSMTEIQDRHLAGIPESVRIRSWRKRKAGGDDKTRPSDSLLADHLETVEYADRLGTSVEDRWPDRFHWCLVHMGNNHLDMPFNRFPYTLAMLMKQGLAEDKWQNEGRPVRAYEHRTFLSVWDTDNLYMPQNQVEIHFADTPRGPILALAHFTPNFERLETRRNGESWQETPVFSPLRLEERMTIEARTVNAAGLTGKTVRVVLERT